MEYALVVSESLYGGREQIKSVIFEPLWVEKLAVQTTPAFPIWLIDHRIYEDIDEFFSGLHDRK